MSSSNEKNEIFEDKITVPLGKLEAINSEVNQKIFFLLIFKG